MADVTFPTLSRGTNLDIQEASVDPTIRSEMENGIILTRARFTKLRKAWSFSISFLTAADKVLLDTMQENIHIGAGTIAWTHPKTAVEYESILMNPIVFRVEPGNSTLQSALFRLEEV